VKSSGAHDGALHASDPRPARIARLLRPQRRLLQLAPTFGGPFCKVPPGILHSRRLLQRCAYPDLLARYALVHCCRPGCLPSIRSFALSSQASLPLQHTRLSGEISDTGKEKVLTRHRVFPCQAYYCYDCHSWTHAGLDLFWNPSSPFWSPSGPF